MAHINCDVCRVWMAVCMVSPLRCGGIHYNEFGQAVCNSGRLWNDVVEEHDEKHRAEVEKYWNYNKDHLEFHGMKYESK